MTSAAVHLTGRSSTSSVDPNVLLRSYRRTRDPDARDRLVELHLPLVRAIARRHAGSGELFEDLVQVGSIGLIEAIERFDPRRGADLRCFAIPTIAGEMKRHLRDRCTAMRLPRHVVELAGTLRASRAGLSAQLGRAPSLAELARAAGATEEDVVEALQLERSRIPVSLSSANEAGEANGAMIVHGAFDTSDDRMLLAAGFRTLRRRERRILHLYFYAGLSQSEIARDLGLSQIQVSRLLRASLERMRGALGTAQRDRDLAMRPKSRSGG
jgi:RNA polymerase sigma-B factor